MESKAFNGEYSSPKIMVIEVIGQKVLCQSDEVPNFNEGWEFDF